MAISWVYILASFIVTCFSPGDILKSSVVWLYVDITWDVKSPIWDKVGFLTPSWVGLSTPSWVTPSHESIRRSTSAIAFMTSAGFDIVIATSAAGGPIIRHAFPLRNTLATNVMPRWIGYHAFHDSSVHLAQLGQHLHGDPGKWATKFHLLPCFPSLHPIRQPLGRIGAGGEKAAFLPFLGLLLDFFAGGLDLDADFKTWCIRGINLVSGLLRALDASFGRLDLASSSDSSSTFLTYFLTHSNFAMPVIFFTLGALLFFVLVDEPLDTRQW